MKPQKLPKTDSIRAFARFWDTHDVTDFEDQLEEVTEPVVERRTPIALHLKPSEAKAVKRIAKAEGVADAELIHKWISEKILANER